jgi:hypothetical protein
MMWEGYCTPQWLQLRCSAIPCYAPTPTACRRLNARALHEPFADCPDHDWLEIGSLNGGCTIALRQAAASQKRGFEIKIVFAVKDVRAFRAERAAAGLKFGAVHTSYRP